MQWLTHSTDVQDISQAYQQRMVPSQTSADPPMKVSTSAAASKWEVELEVSVLHFALPICPISPAAFVLPAASFAASRPRCVPEEDIIPERVGYASF